MTASLLALALALSLPDAGARRYRVEIAGEPAGYAALDLACDAEGCTARWESALLAPEGAPGAPAAIVRRRVEAQTRRDGRAVRVRAVVEDGEGRREASAGAGPLPASLAELALSAAAEGERRCVRVREEVSGEAGEACATRAGEWLQGEVLGVAVRFRAPSGEPPLEVEIPAQRTRFLADPGAALPASPPRLLGVTVPLAPGASPRRALRFCGRAQEPPARRTAPAEVPREFPEGASCREQTARYVALAAAGGLPARHVVGVAWDGAAFAWHEWAELFTEGAWLPVDPSFRQAPAEGPRFAIARFGPGDERARLRAGREILRCWGAATVHSEP